jgi:hypothetical protein
MTECATLTNALAQIAVHAVGVFIVGYLVGSFLIERDIKRMNRKKGKPDD